MEEKNDEERLVGNYHFLCLECDFGINIQSTDIEAATREAFIRHDAYFEGIMFKCSADHYRITGPDGTFVEF